jgi:hypothetical protein
MKSDLNEKMQDQTPKSSKKFFKKQNMLILILLFVNFAKINSSNYYKLQKFGNKKGHSK